MKQNIKMHYSFRFYARILVFVTLCNLVCSDCGCNKIQRSEFEIPVKVPKPADTDTAESDISNDIPSEFCPISKKEPQILKFAHDEMAEIAEGDYFIGTNEPKFPEDRESPERTAHVDQFYIDKFEVSNAEFDKFVKSTGYVTYAEKFGDSFIFEDFLTPEIREKYKDFRVVSAPWWYKINNTFWKQPEGDGSSIHDRMDHPVVHVSWFDASAFCEWKNKRLPTESEWEVACRGGKKSKLFPWGNKLTPKNEHW